MHRIDGPAAAPGGFFTEGDPGTGTPATVVTDDFMNAVQEELVAVAVSAGDPLDKPTNDQVIKAIRKLIAAAIPAGAVQPFAMSAPPTGWLKCNGAAVSRTAYPVLFAAIGVTFGAGNGSTTFNLPDLRGEFVRGWDDSRGVDTGRTFGSHQADEFKSHTHNTNIANTGGGAFAEASGAGSNNIITQATGGVETRPRNYALLYCIKT